MGTVTNGWWMHRTVEWSKHLCLLLARAAHPTLRTKVKTWTRHDESMCFMSNPCWYGSSNLTPGKSILNMHAPSDLSLLLRSSQRSWSTYKLIMLNFSIVIYQKCIHRNVWTLWYDLIVWRSATEQPNVYDPVIDKPLIESSVLTHRNLARWINAKATGKNWNWNSGKPNSPEHIRMMLNHVWTIRNSSYSHIHLYISISLPLSKRILK